MEFFICPCSATGNVILDGVDQGPNKDGNGNLLPKQCNEGFHAISLKCPNGKNCSPSRVEMQIARTNPISPLKVPFECI